MTEKNRFFAQAWLKPVSEGEMVKRTKVEAEFTDRLGELRRTLPDQFLPLVDRVMKNLHKLTAPNYPFVLTHGDFSEFNLLLDEVSGAISGVVDWPETSILPFGFTLHGVEYGLGAMYAYGWTYRENASHVREHFWATFKQIVQPTKDEVEAMMLARLAGILFRYGTRTSSRNSGTMCGVRGHASDSSLQFIEAFTRDETD
jgi:Ser/Thr protein kinase RdoA (MazF antagonist)